MRFSRTKGSNWENLRIFEAKIAKKAMKNGNEEKIADG